MMIEVVWIILKRNNRFLLIQRSIDDKFGGTWSFPGGKIDPDDISPIDAAARELKEETNLDGHNFKLLQTQCSGKYNLHIFLCNTWSGKLNLSCDDIMGMGWFTIAEIHAISQSLSPFMAKSLMNISYILQQC